MSDNLTDLAELAKIASVTLRNLSPPERRKFLRRLGVTIRRSQADRIAAQRNPDGSAYAPRKRAAVSGKARSKKGAIRRGAMFKKLRSAKHLKVITDGQELTIGFSGRDSKIGRIHQDGDFDRPNENSKPMRYPRRILLGLTQSERDQIANDLFALINRG